MRRLEQQFSVRGLLEQQKESASTRCNCGQTSLRRSFFINCLVVLGISTGAYAQSSDHVLSPYVSAGFAYDSNVFGLAGLPASNVGTITQLDDFSRTTRFGLLLNKSISQQNISADLSVNNVRFSNFGFLNTEGHDLRANWNWHLGRHFSGDIGGSDSTGLAPYIDYNLPLRNLRRDKNLFASASWHYHPSWKTSIRFSSNDVNFDTDMFRSSSRHESISEFNQDYLPSTSSSIGLQLRRLRGQVADFTSAFSLFAKDNYTQDEVKAKLDWKYSPKTSIQILGGKVESRHDIFPDQNFAGTNLRINIDYAATAKTALSATVWREVGFADASSPFYTLNNGVNLGVRWNTTAKLALNAEVRRERRQSTSDDVQAFSYLLNTATLTLVYKPNLHWSIQPSIFHIEKNDGTPGVVEFSRRGVAITAQYLY